MSIKSELSSNGTQEEYFHSLADMFGYSEDLTARRRAQLSNEPVRWQDVIWDCYDCNDPFDCSRQLFEHLFYYHRMGREDFRCHYCDHVTNTYAASLNHLRGIHFETLKLSCDVCDEEFPNYKELGEHRYTHEEDKFMYPSVYHCTLCELVHATYKELETHIQLMHTKKEEEKHHSSSDSSTMPHKRNAKTALKKRSTNSRSSKIRKVNYSEAEEDFLSELVVKHRRIILDKSNNLHCNEQKKEIWKTIEKEFNASSISKTFRSAKNLLSKYKNIKVGIRRSYAANNTDEQLSAAKRNLRVVMGLTNQGLEPNLEDDDEVQFAISSSESASETHTKNTEAENNETVLEIVVPDLVRKDELQNTAKTDPLGTQNVNRNSEKKQWGSKRKNSQSYALLRKRKRLRRTNVDQANVLNDGCAGDAKAAFYLNEEKRAAERHDLQMQLLHAEREEKIVEHEKFLEEHRLRVQLLNAKIQERS